MKDLKRYLISTIITFLAGFFVVLIPALELATTWSDVAWPALIAGATFAGFRLAVKGLVEYLPKLIEIATAHFKR